ncbi:MAG: thioredoxin family protein [Opitutaceae bacterium]|nr:thioredoxin family protein [Opitutaceae bacterium]
MVFLPRLAAVLATLVISTLPLHAAPVQSPHVTTELVAETRTIEAGRPFWVGLRMSMEEHWHTYWVNPGDSGMATTLIWTLPEGFSAGPIQWPVPKKLPTPGLMTYGFEGDILLMVEITPPATMPVGAAVRLAAKAEWLICKEACIPGEAEHTLEILAGAGPAQPDPERAPLFAEARRQLPVAGGTAWPAEFSEQGEELVLSLGVPAGVVVPAEIYFFALSEMVVEPSAPQTARVQGDRLILRLPRWKIEPQSPTVLEGVLVAPGGFPPALPGRAVQIAARRAESGGVVNSSAAAVAPTEVGAAARAGLSSFPLAAIFAFLGGLILNLMPCVFPVLGIKILGFVQQAGADRRKVTMHGWVFTAGVLASFWVLAGALILLNPEGSREQGWGYQFQIPGFVFGAAIFFLVFALNLSGLFEVGASAVGVGSKLQARSGYGGSFFTGVLATVVSTPCSAPMLAPAIGLAVTLPAAQSLALFSLVGLGLSTPYLVLSAFPSLVRMLPRPGAWMETFKQLMAFPLYGTAAYMLWVLAGQVDEGGLLMAMFGLLLVAMAGWAYGRFVQQGRSAGGKGMGLALALAAVVGGLLVGWPRAPRPDAIAWETWSPARVEQLRAEGRTVYVDFTARWCATCQTNKKLVFSSEDVRRAFRDRRIAALKADWTNKDPEITRALAAFGRSAVPFNLIYAPGTAEPTILPEVLTPGIVLDALADAGRAPR